MSTAGDEGQGVGLAILDVLPVGCGLQVQAHGQGDRCLRVRFRAHRDLPDGGRESSEWSGWFEYHDEPIPLEWAVFWPVADA